MRVQSSQQALEYIMRKTIRGVLTTAIGLAAIVLLSGCPGQTAIDTIIAGGTGDFMRLADQASVTVISPQSDLAIAGGSPVEVNWRAVVTTAFSVVDVFLDVDTDPDNGNEIVVFSNLPVTETSALVDTLLLDAGTYRVGVLIRQVGQIVASGYASGRIIINQAPRLYFTSPRNNFTYDRTLRINPSFDVAWTLGDPDSTLTTQIYLDPDDSPNGNEILLQTSSSQTGGSFTFDLPTINFAPGTYRILALVSDGVDEFSYYAPTSIRLRSRLAGYIDLRDLHLPSSPVQGAIFEGFNPRDNAGSFVCSAEDIDGDGFKEVFIAAQFGKPRYIVSTQRTGVGEGYLIYGRSRRFSGVNNLNSTGTLFRGEIYGGVPEVPDPIRPSRGIASFATMADWDGDGVREFAFGIPFTDSVPSGFLEQAGYFRTGAVVVTAGSTLGNFSGQNFYRLGRFGTIPEPEWKAPDPEDLICLEGFRGPKAPSPPGGYGATFFYENWETQVRESYLGLRISTTEFGDYCGESVSVYPFYGGFV